LSPFIAVRSVGGAASRVAAEATAYAHRRAELMVVTTAAGPKPVTEAARPALDAIWATLAPHVNGAYANFSPPPPRRMSPRSTHRRPTGGSPLSSAGTTPTTCSPATTTSAPGRRRSPRSAEGADDPAAGDHARWDGGNPSDPRRPDGAALGSPSNPARPRATAHPTPAASRPCLHVRGRRALVDQDPQRRLVSRGLSR
jgi:hypothetical protein